MKVVITGGAGFIGANLGRALMSTPEVDKVIAVDNLSTGLRQNLEETDIELVEDTILNPEALDAAFDGASAVVIMSREKAEYLGVPILATIKGYAQSARDSRYIATVPGLAIQTLMDKNGLTLKDFDLIEINEAFAAVPLVSCLGILGMDQEEMDRKVNVNGGAVAVGHPIGATGARILITLIYELKRRGQKSGVAAICSGMAQGDAVWIEVE